MGARRDPIAAETATDVANTQRTRAALDLIAEIPNVADAADVSARLAEVVGRFGFDALVTAELTELGRAIDGHVLLVGWNSERIERQTATTPEDPRLARLEPRSRPAQPGVGLDRWAAVPLSADAAPATPAEAAVLRVLRDVVRKRLAELTRRPAKTGERPLLSPRERECLQWTAAGKTTWEIAGILEISQNTIDGYIASATKKLGAVNRTQAVAEALRRGLID